MKKAYSKPIITFESFILNSNIAAGCEKNVSSYAAGACAIYGTGGVGIFSTGISGCDFKPEDMGQQSDTWDGFCYHVPTAANNLFNS